MEQCKPDMELRYVEQVVTEKDKEGNDVDVKDNDGNPVTENVWMCIPHEDNDSFADLECRPNEFLIKTGDGWRCATDVFGQLDCAAGQMPKVKAEELKDRAGKTVKDSDGEPIIRKGWVCGDDTNTTLDEDKLVGADQECEDGKMVTGVDEIGDIICATIPTPRAVDLSGITDRLDKVERKVGWALSRTSRLSKGTGVATSRKPKFFAQRKNGTSVGFRSSSAARAFARGCQGMNRWKKKGWATWHVVKKESYYTGAPATKSVKATIRLTAKR